MGYQRARWAAVVGGATLPLVIGVVGFAASNPSSPLDPVPAPYRAALIEAARDCPALPPGLQAALIEVDNGFEADAVAPNEAIVAQGQLLCELYTKAVASELTGDRVSLALAAFRLGWDRLVAEGGLSDLPVTQAFVAEVRAQAPRFAAALTRALGAGPAGSPPELTAAVSGAADQTAAAGPRLGTTFQGASLPVANPRGVTAALAWARTQVYGSPQWRDLCLNFTARSYGWAHSGTHYAIDHFQSVVPAAMRHWGDRAAPAGALMFWDTGLRAGHVALSLGNGSVVTNDITIPGRISVVPASAIDERWGARYLGWAPPYFPGGILHSEPVPVAKPVPVATVSPSAQP